MVQPGGSSVKIDPIRQRMTAEVAPQSHSAAPEEHVRGSWVSMFVYRL
jgi:hypothetical protein